MSWKKIAAIGLVGLLGAASIGYAYQGTPGTSGPNCTVDASVRAELQTAIQNGDYATFQQIRDEYNIAKGRIWEIIDTPEEFELFSELHEAVTTGDIDRAMEIREELGLPLGGGYGYAHASGAHDGTGKQFHGGNHHKSGPADGTGNAWGSK
ncbi:MAG: hypothetical protein GXN93_02225 [Candidatus Diapherotrites archaeon]|nr:hypothetical protein [Candidatus Diapherotrites archaeon]